MSVVFVNGRTYSRAISLAPPSAKLVPFVSVNMAAESVMAFRSIIGRVDTGAERTLLTLDTAKFLGIHDPGRNPLARQSFTVANGERITCAMMTVYIDLSTSGTRVPQFPVYAGVSDRLINNLFGLDWLYNVCIAVDRQRVHFLFA